MRTHKFPRLALGIAQSEWSVTVDVHYATRKYRPCHNEQTRHGYKELEAPCYRSVILQRVF
jgi:hypothetical protein